MGYHVLAANFVKLDHKGKVPPLDASRIKELQEKAGSGWSDAVLAFRRGAGLGFGAVIISIHRDFAAMDRFEHSSAKVWLKEYWTWTLSWLT